MRSTIELDADDHTGTAATVARGVQAYVLAADAAPAALHVHPDDRDRVMSGAVRALLRRRGITVCVDHDVDAGTIQLRSHQPPTRP